MGAFEKFKKQPRAKEMFFAAIDHRIASKSFMNATLRAPILAKKSLPKKPATPEEVNHLDGITGTKNRTLNMRLITQTVESLWFPEGTSKEEQLARTGAAVMLLKGNQNALKHGLYTKAAIKDRRELKRLMREAGKFLEELKS